MRPEERLAELFGGRLGHHGADWGESVPEPPDWEAHVDGSRPTGVYPMWHSHVEGRPDQWLVRWGCVDLDVKRDGKRRWDYDTEDEAHTAAVNLVRALDVAGKIQGHIEVTKSHGRHVWIFTEPMEAWIVRRALLIICQLADVPPTEVNPKNESFDDPDTLGNYVRIPYPGPAPHSDRFMVTIGGQPIERDVFLFAAASHRALQEQLRPLADLWVPPVQRVILTGEGEYDGNLNDDVTPYIQAVLTNGPTEGRDRSGWLWWLGTKCLDEGLTPECALAVLTSADETWTRKYVVRKDGERYLAEIVEKVYR